MERPGLPVLGPEREFRLVATTNSIAEAEQIARQYELQGYQTKITRKLKGGISLYQVWVAKPPEIIQGEVATDAGRRAPPKRGTRPRGDLPKVSK